jgi:glyoxylase-like metal-dependent hydrolase (beta-lactamase superfamily II)
LIKESVLLLLSGKNKKNKEKMKGFEFYTRSFKKKRNEVKTLRSLLSPPPSSSSSSSSSFSASEEVLPGVHRIDSKFGPKIVHSYLLVGTERTLLVDTGLSDTPSTLIFPYLKEKLESNIIDFVLITHADVDHFGGNSDLKAKFPMAVIMGHQLDADMMQSLEVVMERKYNQFSKEHQIEYSLNGKNFLKSLAGPDTPLDLLITGGESIRLSPNWVVKILFLPGVSRGHVGVYDKKSNSAFIGDAVLHKMVPDLTGRPSEPPTYRDVDEYVRSINALGKLNLDNLYTGHFPDIKGNNNVSAFLRESAEFACKVEGEIVSSMREFGRGNPVTMKQIIERVHENTRNWSEESKYLLAYPVSGHLERMVEKKQVLAERKEGSVTKFKLL